jgi:Fe2+ or Zn2+ uptake regulation protein
MTHTTWDYATRIRQGGHRLTPQRQMILDVICELGGHITPESIYERVHTRAPAVNRATVYRNLDFLCEMRLVVAAHIGRRTVYEIAGEHPHHHLICRACNAVTQVGQEEVAHFFAQIERRSSFHIDMDHLTLFGLCPECRQATARRPR